MLRATALFVCVTSAVVVAAPAPPPSEKELIARHWGKTEGQGEFELKGKQLTIRTVGQPDCGLIGLLGGGDRITMPRVSQRTTGDFEINVKVSDAARPYKSTDNRGTWPGTRAGLFVSGGGYGVEFHLYQYYPNNPNGAAVEEPIRCVWVDAWFPNGGAGSQLKQLKEAEAGKSTRLRVIRKEKTVSVSYSFDGKEWSDPHTPRQALDFPDEVTVGVFYWHSTYQIVEATFDGFTVAKPKEK